MGNWFADCSSCTVRCIPLAVLGYRVCCWWHLGVAGLGIKIDDFSSSLSSSSSSSSSSSVSMVSTRSTSLRLDIPFRIRLALARVGRGLPVAAVTSIPYKLSNSTETLHYRIYTTAREEMQDASIPPVNSHYARCSCCLRLQDAATCTLRH